MRFTGNQSHNDSSRAALAYKLYAETQPRRRQPDSINSATPSRSLLLSDSIYSRLADAPLVSGNHVRLLKDATENYPAWHKAIEQAQRTIHLESYFIRDDETGRGFADALIAKARAGVKVKIIYDWFGALGFTPRRFKRRLEEAGIEVCCFNPPRFIHPFAWLSRDHRKMLTVDGEVGYVFGLCIDQRWLGDRKRGLPPWRDTGVEIRGPVIADLDQAFAQVWEVAHCPWPPDEVLSRTEIPPAGDMSVCVISGAPHSARLYRLDLLVAAQAQRSLWLTDAYFVPTSPYAQALCAAAMDGVDVRVLIPGLSDVPFTRAMMRSDLRPLLEAGVRIFEWRGTMLHAKTAVADGCWSRVGSTNLNLSSWISNWELDIAVEDKDFAREMERMYEEDLANATEIVLHAQGKKARHVAPPRAVKGKAHARPRASVFYRISRIIGMVITNLFRLNPSEALMMGIAGLIALITVAIIALWPWVIAGPFVLIGSWIALALLTRAVKLFAAGKKHAEFRLADKPTARRRQES